MSLRLLVTLARRPVVHTVRLPFRTFSSDGGKKFTSVLGDSGVTSPFSDPSRKTSAGVPNVSRPEPILMKEKTTVAEKTTETIHERPDVKEMAAQVSFTKAEPTSVPPAAPLAAEKPMSAVEELLQLKKDLEAAEAADAAKTVAASASTSAAAASTANKSAWRNLTEKLGIAIDENASEEEKRRQKMTRNTKVGSFFVFGGGLVGLIAFCLYYGRGERDEHGNIVVDEFTGPLAPFYRIINSIKVWRDYVVEPSREKLLPDPLPAPYLQPKYTLVIEMKNVLISPEWTYKTGYRFIKRPALDYFLDVVGYPNFEVVIYTVESSMTAPPVIDSFDPKQRIMYRLYRDCTKYANNHHIKDLSKLNRDMSKVIFIDTDAKSSQLNPDNLLLIPKWEGDMQDRALVDLAELLKTIHLSDVEDVRETLQYYSQFEDPSKEFRRRAMYLAEQESQRQTAPEDQSMLKRYSGKLFGFRRHAA